MPVTIPFQKSTRRPKHIVDALVKKFKEYLRKDAGDDHARAFFHGLHYHGASAAELTKRFREEIGETVESVLEGMKRDQERIKAILEPLTRWLTKRIERGELLVELPGRVRGSSSSGGVYFKDARMFWKDGTNRLFLHFEINWYDDEQDRDGETRLDFEVPLDLADAFDEEPAKAWLRAYNKKYAAERLAETLKAREKFEERIVKWNAKERQNS